MAKIGEVESAYNCPDQRSVERDRRRAGAGVRRAPITTWCWWLARRRAAYRPGRESCKGSTASG